MPDKLSLLDEVSSFRRMLELHKKGFDSRFVDAGPFFNVEFLYSSCANCLKAIRSPMSRYGLALVLVAAAVALWTWLDPVLAKLSDVVFLGAILVAAWVGGVGPALVCVILLHFVRGYWFQTPNGLWEPSLSSILFTIACYGLAILVGALSRMHTSAEKPALDNLLETSSQREHFHTALLSCMGDGVLVTDVNGRVTRMNPAAESLTGWNMADSKGKPWWEILAIHREDRHDEVENPIRRVLDEGRVVHERMPLVLTSRTGIEIPIAYSAASFHNLAGQTLGVVLIFRDESERRSTELAWRTADRRKDEVLATVAHELRNPLASISMGMELLKTSADPQAAEQVRSMMQRQTQHMVRLIDDLLDMSRITNGMLELRKTPVDVADIVHDALEATQPLVDEAKHQLTVRLADRPLLVHADSNRLTQVFINLLNNAAKYTPHQGRIELTAEHTDSDIIVTVSDSGIGIPADKIDCVFDMFARISDGGECGPVGMGIGLTLVKRLVEMHSGSVEVHSRGRNLGTTFRLRLPALPVPPAAFEGMQSHSQPDPRLPRH